MTWPTDTLTNANTDNPLDRPDLARDEINSAILMLKSILAEAPAGSSLLTNQDEGAGNGLDADTVDGQQAAAFAAASHNHSTANITSGTFTVPRGGTGLSTIPIYNIMMGNATGPVSLIPPGTINYVLTSNGGSSSPTFKALPSFPTVDVHASDFINGSVGVYPDTGLYRFNTNFGTDAFQWGISGINTTGAIVVGYSNGSKYQNVHAGDTDGITIDRMPSTSVTTGWVNLAISGPAFSQTVYWWARKNI